MSEHWCDEVLTWDFFCSYATATMEQWPGVPCDMELLLSLYLRISGFDQARFPYTALMAVIPCVFNRILLSLHLM